MPSLRDIRSIFLLMKEAKRRGISMDELEQNIPTEDLIAIISRAPDVTRWGLVPDSEVSIEHLIRDSELSQAREAALRGSWEPANVLLANTQSDYDRRQYYVETLADIAADDDGWLKEWRSTKPENPDAEVVYAHSLVKLAWQIRGGLRASETSADRFAGFHKTLTQAQEAAEKATQLAPDDPTPWATLVTMARGLSMERNQFSTLWQGLIARAPHHRAGHDQALQYWCPKWHGSPELMFSFAQEAAAKTEALSALPLQAAYEYEDTDASVWRRPEIRRAIEATLTWVDGEGAQSVAANSDRSFAVLGLIGNKRFDEAVAQYRIIGSRADSWAWSYASNPKLRFLSIRHTACKGAKKPKKSS